MTDRFEGTVESLMNSLENYISTKTILGEPIQFKDTVIFPMADVSFGVAAGAFNKNKDGQNNGAGGVGARVTPSAILVIQNGTSRVVNIKDRDSLNKLIDMIPDFVNKITNVSGRGNNSRNDGRGANNRNQFDGENGPRIEDYL